MAFVEFQVVHAYFADHCEFVNEAYINLGSEFNAALLLLSKL